MANKYFRKNLNKGGGADTGKIGEIKSKLATIGNPFKRIKTCLLYTSDAADE